MDEDKYIGTHRRPTITFAERHRLAFWCYHHSWHLVIEIPIAAASMMHFFSAFIAPQIINTPTQIH